MTTTGSASGTSTTDVAAARPGLRLGRRASGGLVLFGLWSWVIWLTFLKNIWADDRSWSGAAGSGGPTAFFLVHAVIIGTSLVLGTAIGWLGVRGWRALRP